MGQRICIMGISGSGKSTLASQLGRKLKIPVYHLDRELLHGNFQKHSAEKQQALHAQLVSGENWVIDGDYRNLLPERLKRATVIIFINTSRPTAIKRILQRYLTGNHVRASIPEAAKNTLSWQLIWWTARYSRRQRLAALRETLKQKPQIKLLVLGEGTIEDWVTQVTKK